MFVVFVIVVVLYDVLAGRKEPVKLSTPITTVDLEPSISSKHHVVRTNIISKNTNDESVFGYVTLPRTPKATGRTHNFEFSPSALTQNSASKSGLDGVQHLPSKSTPDLSSFGMKSSDLTHKLHRVNARRIKKDSLRGSIDSKDSADGSSPGVFTESSMLICLFQNL